LTNAAGAIIRSSVGNGSSRELNAPLDNQGALDVKQPLTISAGSGQHTSSGTITLAASLTVNESNSGSFTSSGSIDLGTQTLAINGGAFNFDGGSMAGSGTLALVNTTARFTPDFSDDTTSLTINGSIINGPGTVTNAPGRSLTLQNSTINANLVN